MSQEAGVILSTGTCSFKCLLGTGVLTAICFYPVIGLKFLQIKAIANKIRIPLITEGHPRTTIPSNRFAIMRVSDRSGHVKIFY